MVERLVCYVTCKTLNTYKLTAPARYVIRDHHYCTRVYQTHTRVLTRINKHKTLSQTRSTRCFYKNDGDIGAALLNALLLVSSLCKQHSHDLLNTKTLVDPC